MHNAMQICLPDGVVTSLDYTIYTKLLVIPRTVSASLTPTHFYIVPVVAMGMEDIIA